MMHQAAAAVSLVKPPRRDGIVFAGKDVVHSCKCLRISLHFFISGQFQVVRRRIVFNDAGAVDMFKIMPLIQSLSDFKNGALRHAVRQDIGAGIK